MKRTVTAASLFLLIGFLFLGTARAQQGKLIVLSPKVGTEIDAAEAAEYDLFHTIRGFHSAQFYQREDGTFRMVIQRRIGDDGVIDSTNIETYRSLTLIADRIDHSELLQRGEYQLGAEIPTLSYEDGTRVSADGQDSIVVPVARNVLLQSDSIPRQIAGVARQAVYLERNNLPLAKPSHGMVRPKFKSLDFVMSLGTSFIDVAALSELLEVGRDYRLHGGVHLAVHLSDEYRVRLIAGGVFSPNAPGGIEFHTFSSTILWRLYAHPPVSPLLGIGACRTYYRASNAGIIASAEYTYPMLALGLSMENPNLDIVFTYSDANISTEFENKSYTISLAGPSLQIMLSL